jgi:serine/threonine-protein kinase
MSRAHHDSLALELVDGALELPADAREAWIMAQAVAPEVKDRALKLLRLGDGAAEVLPTGGARHRVIEPPDRIGAYRITGLIGQGGMGAVFEGERAVGDFDHAVAIKVIRPGALSDGLAERFRRERQTLARLAHPGIARLFDGGETVAGEPYIVMEKIDGLGLDAWLKAETPGLAARIGLMSALCDAVAYAHQNLVVHGDITPSNVLVAEGGAPKLIDFGIARAVGGSGAGGRTSLPPGAISLTPGFASPERLAGGAVTTLSDIYSLGMILQRLAPDADRELNAVIGKAAAARPEDRYPTADQLRADLVAYQTGRPLAALGGGRGYVTAKFVRRHRVAVAASALAVVMLIGALSATLVANARAEAARAQAEARFAEVRGLAKTLMFEIYDEINRVPGSAKARLLLAETAQAYLDRLAADPGAPVDVRVEAGEGYFRLGRVIGFSGGGSLGRREDGKHLLNKSEQILEDLLKAHPEREDVKLALGSLLAVMAGESLYAEGDSKTGRKRAERARALLAAVDPPSPRSAGALTAAYLYEGDSYGWDNDIPGAGAVYEKGLTAVAAMPPELRDSEQVREFHSGLLRQSGEVHRHAGRVEPALARMQEAVAVNRRNVAEAGTPSATRKLVASLWSLADMQRVSGRLDPALATIAEAHRIAKAEAAKGAEDAGPQEGLALVGLTLAQVQSDRGAHAAALAAANEAIAIRRALAVKSGGNKGSRLALAVGLKDVSQVYGRAGQAGRGCAALRESQAIMMVYETAGSLSDFDRENNLKPVQAGLKACT